MYSYFKGDFIIKKPSELVIEVNGIGFELQISLNTFGHISELEKGLIYTYLHVREDAQILFGFSSLEEKQLFIDLISVSGIGPNTARVVLSAHPPQEIAKAILHENLPLIQGIKGIGPKTAKRLILELKDKIGKTLEKSAISDNSDNMAKEEALSALQSLGYSRNQAEKAMATVIKSNPELNEAGVLVREVLKRM